MRNHTMIDLETFALGTRPAIVQVGVAIFDPDGVREIEVREWNVTLQSSVLAGLDFDHSTARWWYNQSAEARKSISGAAWSLETVLANVTEFIVAMGGGNGIWAHGAAADVPWLDSAYSALGQRVPWDYRQVRDTRTLFWLARAIGWRPVPREGIAHTAGQDALWQAKDVIGALRAVRHGTPPSWPADLDELPVNLEKAP
jgi:hypothetical protein